MLHSSVAPKNSTVVRSKTSLRFARAALQAAYLLHDDLGTHVAERLFTTPRRHVRPDRERALLARARRFPITVQLRSPRWHDTTTTVTAWRWGYSPTIALLVHGWEGRGAQLGAFVDPLLAAGLSVVTFDAPAHGDSPGQRLYLTDMADAIADVVAAIGHRVHAIVAHSFGAAAVLLAHARHGIDAPRNVFLAPNAIIEDAVVRFARAIALDDTDRIALERLLADHTGVPLTALALDALAATRDAALLVVHDRADREVPFTHAERLAATWPNAQLHPTDGLGHRRILRDSNVIADIVAFASTNLPAPASDLVREVDRLVASP
jgi:pimeloyl-ACP methyl ester carboxylesterase